MIPFNERQNVKRKLQAIYGVSIPERHHQFEEVFQSFSGSDESNYPGSS
jgi:hypothetical protein